MPPAIEFEENGKRELVLRRVAGEAALPADAAALAAAAAAAGYGDLQFDVAALAAAVRRLGGDEDFFTVIGRRADAGYRVDVAADKMTATLTVVAAQGGAAADAGDAGNAVSRAGVVFGVDPTALARAVASPGTAVPVAEGTLPRAGSDARLETLVEVGQAGHLHEDAHGHIDFRELGVQRSVAAGMPLMRRHPPLPGTPGHTVLGTEIPAASVRDVKFAVRLQGVAVSPDDPDLLVAAIDGKPVVHRDGIGVDPVLVLPGVNLSTGNVDFVGSVEIKGDVQSGMKIKAGGGVVIHGTLESAEVDAGGDVEVKGGVIGQRSPAGRGNDVKLNGARIQSKGNVRTHHVDNATIVAQSVFVDESIVQSDVTAMEQVVVGKEGARKGHIIGGTVRAAQAVTALCLGSPGSSETCIMAGMSPLLLAAINAKKAAAAAKRKEHDDIEKVVKVLQTRPERAELLAKARLTLEKTGEELEEIAAEQAALEAELKLADEAQIVVKSTVHPGVAITIGRKRTVVTEQLGIGAFRLVVEENGGREEEVVVFRR